jgi:hypothetical protein
VRGKGAALAAFAEPSLLTIWRVWQDVRTCVHTRHASAIGESLLENENNTHFLRFDWKAFIRIIGGAFMNPQSTRGNGESAERVGGAILRLVAQTLFVAVFFHPLAAFVFCDF